MPDVYYQFFHDSRLLGEGKIASPFTVGRQSEATDVAPVSVLQMQAKSPQCLANGGVPRKLVIVPLSNRSVPRLSLHVEVDRNGTIIARNLHRLVELGLPENESIGPNQQRALGLQGVICFPDSYKLSLASDQPYAQTLQTNPESETFGTGTKRMLAGDEVDDGEVLDEVDGDSVFGRQTEKISDVFPETPVSPPTPPISSPQSKPAARAKPAAKPKPTSGAQPASRPKPVSMPPQPPPTPQVAPTSQAVPATYETPTPPITAPAARAPSPPSPRSSDNATAGRMKWSSVGTAGGSRLNGSDTPQAEKRSPGHDSYIPLDYERNADVKASRLLSMIGEEQSGRQEIAVRLVRTALEAFKEPPGSKEFFAAAGRAAIQMIDLDRVAVLRKEDGEWMCRALSFRQGLNESRAAAREFSQTLLSKMEAAGKTMIVDPQLEPQNVWRSIIEVDRAVASPIFGENNSIVGALYGDRLIGESENNKPIGELEAALLEVLATGISSSLAIKQEQRLRSSMSPFFSPEVLSQLKRDRTLLEGRETNVTVLFCDVRGFSAVTEKIGPTKSIEWINDVLTTLSECVLAHDGVLVDYIGDELMAMWGAPGEQADHAERACRAALDMLGLLEPIQEKWKGVVPNRFGFGIGINSGPASVGNTGSKQKFKYGPIGNAVNLASRVQGVTKQIGVPGMITGATAEAVRSANFLTRRLAKVRVVGINQPIDMFQLCENESYCDLCQRYEKALSAYEENDLKSAAGGLASLVQDYPDDRPTIILLSRTVELLTQPDREFDPVWNLTQK